MPSIKQSADYLQKAKDAGKLTPETPAPAPVMPSAPAPPAYPSESNPRLRTPMPASTVLQPDTQRQFFNNASSPQTRMLPQTAAASPSVGAASSSQAAAVVAATPAASADLDLIGINEQTGTTYTVNESDLNTIISMSNNSGGTIILPANNVGGGTFYQMSQPSSQTSPATVSMTNLAGSTIIVSIKVISALSTAPSISDTQGNTYNLIDSVAETTGAFNYTFLFYAHGIVGGPNVITITRGVVTVLSHVIEYTNMPTVASLDQHSSNGNHAPMQGTPITTGVSNALVIASYWLGVVETFTGGPGWTNRYNNNISTTTAFEDQVVAASGTTVTGTTSPAVSPAESTTITASFATSGQSAQGLFPKGWFTYIENTGVGSFLLHASGLTIDGSTSDVTVGSNQGLLLIFDGTNWLTERGLGGGTAVSVGGVNAQTVTYTALAADSGKLISMNGSSITLNLPAVPPAVNWWIAVENTNASSLTLNRNGLNIDGSASNLTIKQNQGVLVYTDGTNYFTERGISPVSAADLSNGTTGTGLIVLQTSPALLGVPTAPTPATSDDSTTIATTAYVQNQGFAPVTGAIDTLNVNGTIVVTPFSFTALVNGVGPVGETEVNGQILANNRPVMVPRYSNITPTYDNLAYNNARLVNTVYYNDTPYTLLVQAAMSSGSTGNIVWNAFCDTSTSPSTVVFKGIGTNSTVVNTVTLTFFVPSGSYYKVTNSGGTPTTSSWAEYVCQVGTITDSGEIHASRALATVYQNNSAKTMFVAAQIASVNASSSVQGISDSSPAPTNVIDDATQSSSGANTVTVFFIVPPYHYYKVTAATGSVNLWHEYSWNINCTKSRDLISSTAGTGIIRWSHGEVISLNTGAATQSAIQLQCWFNNNPTIRWIHVINSNNTAPSFVNILTGDGVPSAHTSLAAIAQQVASTPRHIYCPILPWWFYGMQDTSGNTLTDSHWWEYQLG